MNIFHNRRGQFDINCCYIMQNFFSYLFLLVFIPLATNAQNKLPAISLNHIYIVLDSETYNNLFDSSFMEKELGNIKSTSVTTTDDSWSGKYFFGKKSYLEFFNKKSFK